MEDYLKQIQVCVLNDQSYMLNSAKFIADCKASKDAYASLYYYPPSKLSETILSYAAQLFAFDNRDPIHRKLLLLKLIHDLVLNKAPLFINKLANGKLIMPLFEQIALLDANLPDHARGKKLYKNADSD